MRFTQKTKAIMATIIVYALAALALSQIKIGTD